ncbi:Elongation of fatty acids protein 3-like [Glycine soja]
MVSRFNGADVKPLIMAHAFSVIASSPSLPTPSPPIPSWSPPPPKSKRRGGSGGAPRPSSRGSYDSPSGPVPLVVFSSGPTFSTHVAHRLRRRKLVFFQLFYHAISAFMSFLWLEFSRSSSPRSRSPLCLVTGSGPQYVAAQGECLPLVLNCRIALLGCNLVCHVAVSCCIFYRWV